MSDELQNERLSNARTIRDVFTVGDRVEWITIENFVVTEHTGTLLGIEGENGWVRKDGSPAEKISLHELKPAKSKPRQSNTSGMWVVGAKFGHTKFAGLVRPNGAFGSLIQLDIPDGDGFRTIFLNEQSVFEMEPVSEQVAREVATQLPAVHVYDGLVVSQDKYQAMMQRLQEQNYELSIELRQLQAGDEQPDSDEDGIPF